MSRVVEALEYAGMILGLWLVLAVIFIAVFWRRGGH